MLGPIRPHFRLAARAARGAFLCALVAYRAENANESIANSTAAAKTLRSRDELIVQLGGARSALLCGQVTDAANAQAGRSTVPHPRLTPHPCLRRLTLSHRPLLSSMRAPVCVVAG